VIALSLVFVCLSHDEILDEGEWIMLVHVRRVMEVVVLLKVMNHVGMQ
jgi:hypothetical protein